MPSHVHGPRYVRPDDRGRCTHRETAFGCLVQCDSPEVAGSGTCLAHWVATQLSLPLEHADQLIAEYVHHHGGSTA